MSTNRLLRLLQEQLKSSDTEQEPPTTPQHPADEEDTIVGPGPGTMSVKRQDLGIKEMSIGQYFFPQEPPKSGFTRLPANRPAPEITPWYMELGLEGLGVPPLRLEIVGPVVIGRGAEADLSLSGYDAIRYGISRQHAILRPSPKALYFVELGSTNGSRLNGVDVQSGRAYTLQQADVIRLGTLTLVVRHLQQAGGSS